MGYLQTVKCPICGKDFISAPQHNYWAKAKKGKMRSCLCSYKCVLRYETEEAERLAANRIAKAERLRKNKMNE